MLERAPRELGTELLVLRGRLRERGLVPLAFLGTFRIGPAQLRSQAPTFPVGPAELRSQMLTFRIGPVELRLQ